MGVDRVRVFYLARFRHGEFWHYMPHESSTKSVCGVEHPVEWWRFGRWDITVCQRCEDMMADQRVVVVARKPAENV